MCNGTACLAFAWRTSLEIAAIVTFACTKPQDMKAFLNVVAHVRARPMLVLGAMRKHCFIKPGLRCLLWKKSYYITLPVLQKNFVNIFCLFAWEFCIEKRRGFLVNFFWSPSPTNRSANHSSKNSGQNSGRNIEKFGKLSFCNFPDLILHQHTSKFQFARLTLLRPPNRSVSSLAILHPYTPSSSHVPRPVLARPRPALARPSPGLARSSPAHRPPWSQASLPSRQVYYNTHHIYQHTEQI